MNILDSEGMTQFIEKTNLSVKNKLALLNDELENANIQLITWKNRVSLYKKAIKRIKKKEKNDNKN